MTVIDPFLDKTSRGTEQGPSRDHAMLAHDLRGALQSILGGISVIDAAALNPDLRAAMDCVSSAAEAVSCLLNILLDEGGDERCDTPHCCVDLASFVAYLERRWSGEALRHGLRFSIVTGADLPLGLSVDFVTLGRIVGNLVGNSIRHAKVGTIQMTLSSTREGGIKLLLSDEGPGVRGEVLDRVNRGYVPSGSKAPMHGLGLHIVRELSKQIGGEIVLGNRPGGGFLAELTFPYVLCRSVSPEAETIPIRPADLEGVRLLLAEDNPTNQMVAAQMLRALKADVTLASDGVEALERFEASVFDLVVVDIEMPRLSGLDVIRAIRAREDERASVPIVALTAYALREHQDRISAAGANGLISKPISNIEALGRGLAGYLTPKPVAVESPREGPVVDMEVYRALREAIGPDMMAELMEKVVIDLVSARTNLMAAQDAVLREPIRSSSHILISVAGAIGATRLQASARNLNIAAHGEDYDGIRELTRHCLAELEGAVKFASSKRDICAENEK